MRVNCREQIANPAEPVNGQDERRKCAAIPPSRSITRPQATTFAQQNRPLQKENTILTDGVESVKKACHCEPVRAAKQVPLGYTLARQSVSKTNKFCAFPQIPI